MCYGTYIQLTHRALLHRVHAHCCTRTRDWDGPATDKGLARPRMYDTLQETTTSQRAEPVHSEIASKVDLLSDCPL